MDTAVLIPEQNLQKKQNMSKKTRGHFQKILGRQYTKISRILIHSFVCLDSQAFWFSKAIIHGMWTMAHALSKLRPNPLEVEVHSHSSC